MRKYYIAIKMFMFYGYGTTYKYILKEIEEFVFESLKDEFKVLHDVKKYISILYT